jgi:hypothetical protein
MVATNCLTNFAKICALKSLMKQEITWFLYEQIFIRFGTTLKIVFDNGPQFFCQVVENFWHAL